MKKWTITSPVLIRSSCGFYCFTSFEEFICASWLYCFFRKEKLSKRVELKLSNYKRPKSKCLKLKYEYDLIYVNNRSIWTYGELNRSLSSYLGKNTKKYYLSWHKV